MNCSIDDNKNRLFRIETYILNIYRPIWYLLVIFQYDTIIFALIQTCIMNEESCHNLWWESNVTSYFSRKQTQELKICAFKRMCNKSYRIILYIFIQENILRQICLIWENSIYLFIYLRKRDLKTNEYNFWYFQSCWVRVKNQSQNNL